MTGVAHDSAVTHVPVSESGDTRENVTDQHRIGRSSGDEVNYARLCLVRTRRRTIGTPRCVSPSPATDPSFPVRNHPALIPTSSRHNVPDEPAIRVGERHGQIPVESVLLGANMTCGQSWDALRPRPGGQFPKHAARSIVERQSVRLSYADCPITPKVVTGTLSYSVASVVIYLRHCAFARSARNIEALSAPGTPSFSYEMTTFSPHRTTLPNFDLAFYPRTSPTPVRHGGLTTGGMRGPAGGPIRAATS